MSLALAEAELAVLGLLFEGGPLSGYRMLTLVAERGMVEWAGLSPTSVYNSLKKLRARGLASAVRDAHKQGRGPAGLLFAATKLGRSMLRQQVSEALVSAREHSPAFKLALAFSGCLTVSRSQAQLRKRGVWLQGRIARIGSARSALQAEGEPQAASLLFEYVHSGLMHEVAVVERLAQRLGAGRE